MRTTDIHEATARLYLVAKVLNELNTDIFSYNLEGVMNKESFGEDKAESALLNCQDWMINNYNLVANVVSTLSYVCEDMTAVVDDYICKNESENRVDF